MTLSVQKSIHEADASGIPDRRRRRRVGKEMGVCARLGPHDRSASFLTRSREIPANRDE